MKAIFDVVTEDYELIAMPMSAAIGNPSNFEKEETFSKKAKIDGKKILTKLSWSVKPGSCIMPGCSLLNGSVEKEISAGSKKCKVESSNAFLKLDQGTCVGVFQPNAPGPTIPCKCNIFIKDSGQSKVKAL